ASLCRDPRATHGTLAPIPPVGSIAWGKYNANRTRGLAAFLWPLRLRCPDHPTGAHRTRNALHLRRARFAGIVTAPKRNWHYRRAVAVGEATLFDEGSQVVLKYVLRGDKRRK